MHKIHLDPSMERSAAVREEPPPDADQVYVLLTDRYRISRNIRAQWYLQTLNTVIRLEEKKNIEDCENEIDIISIYTPYTEERCPHHRNFRITPTSQFKFFSRKYSFVYIIDLSTSLTNVDVHHSTVLTDEILPAITKCLKCLSEPFIVPGSKFIFEPEIYISIIVYSPFYSGDFNNVIVHGFKLCRNTYKQLFDTLTLRFHDFMEELKLNIEREGTKLECANFRKLIKSNLVSADQSLVNMIRFGLLTLNLLPENCHQGMIIVTDGDFSFPDSNTLESALGQLRLGMISCSFIQIGSPAHPNSSFGHVPYHDFMKFFSKATFGAFISISPDYNCFPLNRNDYNVFHKAFFIWSFQYDCSSFYQELHGPDYRNNIWKIDNPYFYTTCDDYYEPTFGKKDQLMIRRRQNESMLTASLAQILTYRLREGFTIKRVHLRPNDNRIEMLLVLPWRHSVNIEYNIISTYQPESADEDEQREITYEIIVEGSYSFLHDATCSASNKKHGIRSIYRAMTIKHFWDTLANFGKSDLMSIRFHNFAKNELHRSMPESVKRGVPLFYLPPNSQKPEVQFVNDAHSRFSNYWRQICLLDMNTCQRSSLHTFQVNFLLRHDSPLPEFLYLPNSNGRYDNIQCNQAVSVLNVMLKDWCSFVLLENHSYIKLIGETCSATCSFYLVRIVSQPPCVVLHLAFIGGTSSCLRNQIINELNLKLKQCKFPQRNLSSSLVQNLATEASSKVEEPNIPQSPPVSSDETNSSPLPYFTSVTSTTSTAATTTTSNTSNTEAENEPKSGAEEEEEEQPVSQVNFKVGGDSNPPTANPSPVTTVSTNSNSSSDKRTRNLSGQRHCFILLNRPIERMLVRYERIPKDFFNCYKYEEDLKSSGNSSHIASLSMFQTLTRYLCHKRFIWYTHSPQHTGILSVSAVSKILTVLTMKRLNEGFSLAYNDGGIVNLVMEVKMRDEKTGVESPCLVQYIIFPSNISLRNKESISLETEYEEEPNAEPNSGDHLLVTECWVEPQNGLVVPPNEEDQPGSEGAADFLQRIDFDQISVSFFKSDKEVISCLLTYEHLLVYTNFDPDCPSCPGEIYNPIPSVTKKDAHHPQNPPPPPELRRFNSTPYHFELLKLLSLSQQALIKFSMLFQAFDLPPNPAFDQPSQMSDCPNMILYSEFLSKLLHLHDKELEFSHADSSMFIEMVNKRADKSSSPDQNDLFFANYHLLIANPIIRFKCYCKQISPNCLMLTLLPFSYKVVRQLSFIGEEDKLNRRLISEFKQNDKGALYGALAVPIFVYKITFNSLSQILLKSAEGNELQLSESWNLFFDYSLNCNKFYYETFAKRPQGAAAAAARPDELPLESFCKCVEITYWNSFTDAVYKSLQYGFPIDRRDKTLVMEKISLKSIHYIDITEFLIYTCKHLRPLVNEYFERFPGHCISDLIDYIFGRGQQQREGQQQQQGGVGEKFEPLKLKDVFSSAGSRTTNCHPNSESLKSAFVSYIQTHFTLIPDLPDNYYFFDYENIQNVNYRPGGDERAQKRREELLKTYRKVEEDETDLSELIHRGIHYHSENSDMGDVDIVYGWKDEVDQGIEEQDMDLDGGGAFIFSKPFFVGFSYTFSFRNGSQVLKTTSIPTCLCELFTAHGDANFEEIELEDLRVNLCIEIITQNFAPSIVSSKRVSMASNECCLETSDTLCFINNTLDGFQVYKYKEFVAHIEYMIRDEVVNISHNSYPVSARTLDIVVKHIRESKKSQTYSQKLDKVELKFIIEEEKFDRCLGQLKDMLSELSLPGNFKLTAMGEYFYVVHQTVTSESSGLNRPTLIFTSNREESFEQQENCLVFNEELFEDSPQYETSKIVSEYTVEGNQSSNLTPNFWLILTFYKTDAWMYFHSNHSIYLYGSSIFDQLRRSIERLVKRINQIVLLERLDETRECENLLITVEDRDPYTKANIRSALNSTPVTAIIDRQYPEPDPDPELEMTDDKNFKLVRKSFAPGSFACSVVWEKHFPLHPRLHGKDGMSAIRSVLSSFTVTNRNNLYVYKEKSGSIFYLRIYEIECTRHLFNDSAKFSYAAAASAAAALSDTSSSATLTEELASEIDSCYHYDNIIASGDAMNDSMHRGGDSDRETDRDSIASFNNSPLKPIDRLTQCILLNVHGVTEPGVFIKDDMVMALQKKLDEAVLDNLILTLTRNPLSKFTYEDVCFIQSQNSAFDNFYFVINENYMPYVANIKAYIRQNLSTLMSSPKYTDANPEFHFKLFKNDEFHCVLDEDVFILHCQQESGRDSRGVACVILSIVSKEKITTGLTSAFVLSKTDVNDFILGNFDNITSCYSHQQENTNASFYINFQIWSSGKIDTEEHLKRELINIIRQSLWDFNLEFNIFKLCSFEDSRGNFNSISEPTTPKKLSEKRERRSGLSIIQQTGSNFDDAKFFSSQQLWKRSDVSSPHTANVPSASKKNYFDFEMNLDKVNDLSGNLQEAKNRELYSLSRTINVAVKPYLDFGSQKNVFSLKKYSFNLVQKNSISTIIKEFNGFISNFGGDMNVDLLVTSPQNYSCDLDLNSAESTFGESNHLMILLRHEALWSAKYLHADMENSFTRLYHKLKNERAKLYFQPVFSASNKFWGNESNTNLSDTGRAAGDEQWMRCIAPRQKFLLLFVEDRNIQLYLYNWSASHVTTIVGLFSNLIIWHNSRSLLQQSLILQKAGIFHHLPFKRHSFEDILVLSKVKLKDLSLPSIINIHQHSFSKETPNLGSHIFKNTDMLLKHTNPLDAFKDYQQQHKEAHSRSETIFDHKNYSFIFSSIESPSARNLFDCFNAQFNSHYNTYIKDLKDLSKMWQLHGSKLSIATMERITNYTKKYGRLSHFCLTPFLFSHKWRYSMAMIRDHTLPLGSGRDRSRHMSGGLALTKSHSIDHEFAPSAMTASSKRSRRKSGPPNMLEHSTLAHRVNMDECLDSAVCSNYIHEYVQYLQSLGFSSIKSQKSVPLVTAGANGPSTSTSSNFDQQALDRRGELRGGGGGGQKPSVTFSSRKSSSYSKNEIIKFYSIKTLPGGFFIFEIGFCEPYVYTYLYAFDLTRFCSWSKNDSFMAHMNTTNFLDELDSIKARMHLHSFTYDYHMRAIHSYISGRQLFFHPGYHLINFLDDFIKYYQKAPNYARNHVYSDDIRFESNRISADQLYKYITDNNKLYELDVIEMNSAMIDRLPLLTNSNKECVLIQLSSHRIPYDDENNIRQEDNFDVGVLITSQKQPYNANTRSNDYNNLCLKFFLLLTSQRELFPKLSPFGDSKGAFKPIRLLPTTSASNSQSRKNSVPKAPDSMEMRLPSSNYPSPFSAYQRPSFASTASQDDQASKMGYSGICDEKINYLGYFNAHEIVMGNVLTQMVLKTKEHLKRIITLAEIDCRRDRLWNSLIPSSSEQQRSDYPMSMEELNELLLLVKSIRLDDYDITLSEFYAFNYPWYRSLAQKLELKFEFTHRKFIAKDNNAHCKMAFFKNNCKDCFILFELKNSVPFVDFKIVFKKPHDTEIDYSFLEHCNPQYHELVEDFINACTSHMWSAMMS